jgi:hypothetical protein
VKGDAEYIRRHYGVPAYRLGRIVFCDDRPGTITGFRDAHLVVRLDENPKRIRVLHPTWRVQYLPRNPRGGTT